MELAVFGDMPKSPTTTLEPVLVTADAPSTPKLVAAPNGIVCAPTGDQARISNDARTCVPPRDRDTRAPSAEGEIRFNASQEKARNRRNEYANAVTTTGIMVLQS